MSLTSLLEKANHHLNKKQPFVLYVLPNEKQVHACFQKTKTAFYTSDFNHSGFYFAPFNSEERTLLIPAYESEVTQLEIDWSTLSTERIKIAEDEKEQQHYVDLVDNAVNYIKKQHAHKIVLSRKKELKLKHFTFSETIERLFHMYHSAFRYVWYHPETGLWCGASPEVLVRALNNHFETMALAGTKKVEGEHTPIWTQKERDEQQIVVDEIYKELLTAATEIDVSESYSQHAGSLWHLRTDISARMTKSAPLEIVNALHPTPAVCGTPKQVAKDFILKNEGYDRSFYTGYLGPYSVEDKKAQWFVNLRCMKIENNTATLFVGGGITAASSPKAEWEETHNKLQTMAQVLAPML